MRDCSFNCEMKDFPTCFFPFFLRPQSSFSPDNKANELRLQRKNISQRAITTVTGSLGTLKHRFNELHHQMKNIRLSCLLLSRCSSSLWNYHLIIYMNIVGTPWQTLTPDLLTGCSPRWWSSKRSRLHSHTPFMSVQIIINPLLRGPLWVRLLWFNCRGRLCF